MGLAFLSGANPFLFFLERKNGRLAREAQPLRRTDAGTSCVVVGRNTAAGMPPSSALSLPVSAAPARQLSRASRPRKRKSSADHAFALFKAVYAILLHKTDGSYVNRPFFRFKQDVRESVFSQIDRLSRSVFCFFSSRKEIVPLSEEKKSYPLEEKEGGERCPQPAGMGSGSGAGAADCETFALRSNVGAFSRQPFG